MPYQAYLLRLWSSPQKDTEQWHASLENVHTHERVVFVDLEGLFTFLSDQTNNRKGDDPSDSSHSPNEESIQ